jgi:hypothetical protein
MNSSFIPRLLAGLCFAILSLVLVAQPSAGSMIEPTTRPETGALKLGDKLRCSNQSYTLKEKVWTWTCVSKNKQRAYSLIHPDWADELFYATGKKCASSRQVWFVFAPNNWAIGVRSKQGTGTKALATEVRKTTGGYADYVCR